ncbi:MAG: DUF4160 domain-containing protein [Candidatus Omnitrophica bacterium]|nr:DUF4160 domain-containing protein [Candidatus Omnitrophota bacterium]
MRNPEKQIATAETLEELVSVLEVLFNEGYTVDAQGNLYKIFVEVARVKGLKVEIRHKEHPPPHFHVLGDGVDASFAIVSGELLKGKIDSRRRYLVKWWQQQGCNKLIQIWNSTRPSDCPVGLIAENAQHRYIGYGPIPASNGIER